MNNYYDLSYGDEPKVDLSNWIHLSDHRASTENFENEHRLQLWETKTQKQQQIHDNTMLLTGGFYEMSGEKERQLIEQQKTIDERLLNQSIPPPNVCMIKESTAHVIQLLC